MNNNPVKPDYLTISQMITMIEWPNRGACERIIQDHRALFDSAQGSIHNHQAWPGGYVDHIVDGMNYARYLYALEVALGRPLPFSLSDVLLVFFLHDLEKPWGILVGSSGRASKKTGLDAKSAFKMFRDDKFKAYGIILTASQMNALTYVRGEGVDHLSTKRVMNELAGFCHMVDVWSARVRHDYPKERDEWTGAGRHRLS